MVPRPKLRKRPMKIKVEITPPAKKAPICPYCGTEAQYIDSKLIYQTSYGMIWLCSNFPKCDARVGCHGGTSVPLGTMANEKLRRKRNEVHAILDPLWKQGDMKRTDAYQLLSDLMGKSVELTHIGMFDEAECNEALDALESWLRFRDDTK